MQKEADRGFSVDKIAEKLRAQYKLSPAVPGIYSATKVFSGELKIFTYVGMRNEENLAYALDNRGAVFWMHFGKHVTLDTRTMIDPQVVVDIAHRLDMIAVVAKTGGRKIYFREKGYVPSRAKYA